MLNLQCVINDRSLGILGLNYTTNLHRLGVDVSLFPLFPPQQGLYVEQEDGKIINDQIKRASFYDPKATCLTIWHPHDLAKSIGRGPRCCYSSFELTPMRKQEVYHLNTMDLAMFPSKWGVDVARQSGVKVDLDHFPHGVNRKIFNESGPTIDNPENKTIFLSVGKWEKRKGLHLLPQVFDAAFTEKDNVELWVSHFNPFSNEEELKQWHALYNNAKLREKIKIFDWHPDPHGLAQLMRSADVGISLSSAEAWNLPLLEMLSCGRHVIATNYSGHTEFLTEQNSKLVSIFSLEPAFDGKWFHGEGQWARIGEQQIEQTVAYMREFHKQKQEGLLELNREGIITAEKHEWIKATAILVEKLTNRGLL